MPRCGKTASGPKPDEASRSWVSRSPSRPIPPEHRLEIARPPLRAAATALRAKTSRDTASQWRRAASEHVGHAIDDRIDEVEHQRLGGCRAVGTVPAREHLREGRGVGVRTVTGSPRPE